ncbi:MAG: hypothetical protein AAFZ15_18925 [Bacteroidota bacterium]
MEKNKPSFRSYLRENGWEMISGLLLSVVGFFLALYIDSLRERSQQHETYASLVEAIRQEAEFNETVLTKSFLPYYEKKYVAARLSVTTVEASLSNSLFVHLADRSTIHLLNEYHRELELSNGFAETASLLRTVNNEVNPDMIEAWGQNMAGCQLMMAKVKGMLPGVEGIDKPEIGN